MNYSSLNNGNEYKNYYNICIAMRDLWSAMMDTLLVNFSVRKEFVKVVLSAPSCSLYSSVI